MCPNGAGKLITAFDLRGELKMVRSMFAGVAGLRTHQSGLDIIGNNIANVNTTGFKGARTVFRESMYQASVQPTDGTTTTGGINSSQVGYGTNMGSIDTMFSTGNYAPTSSQTDCMINGEGYFLVGSKFYEADNTDPTSRDFRQIQNTLNPEDDEIGLDSLKLTRVGDFKLDGHGFLVDGNGNVVYGFAVEEIADDGTITYATTLTPICTAIVDDANPDTGGGGTTGPQKLGSITIDANGVVKGVAQDTEESVVLGKLGICFVQNPGALVKEGDSNYVMRGNTGEAMAYGAGEGAVGEIVSSALEMANVDIANEFSNMILMQRGFQANSRIITVTDAMLEELVNLKR